MSGLPTRNLRQWLRHVKCLFLMVSLILLSVAYPFMHHLRGLLVLAYSLILVSGIYAVTLTPQRFRVAVVLAFLEIITSLVHLVTYQGWLLILSEALLALAFFNTILAVLRYVISGREVTVDKLYGAVAAYFLIGFMWANMYSIVLECNPSAFNGARQRSLVYYSMITLATIGYGDIVPVSDAARTLAMLEGIVGVFYIAVLVSRLVSSYGDGGPDGDTEGRAPDDQ